MRKIGNSPLLILGQRHTPQIVHLYAKKTAAKVDVNPKTVPNLDDNEYKVWGNGDLITALLKFNKEVSLPTITQVTKGATCALLEHHNPSATCKIVEAVDFAEAVKLDKVEQAKNEKNKKKK